LNVNRLIGFLGGVLCLLGCAGAWGVDYTYYLSEHDLTMVRKVDEGFLVKDRYGNHFLLKVSSPQERTIAIANSMLSDLVGLPNAPVYPTFVQQFSAGPLYLGSELAPGASWVPATLQNTVGSARSPSEMHGNQVAEMVTAHAMAYVFGLPAVPESVRFTDSRHFVLANPPQGAAPSPNLAAYLDNVPSRVWRQGFYEYSFVEASNRLLSRLEKITPEQWHRLYGDGPVGSEIRARAATLRQELAKYIEAYEGSRSVGEKLKTPMEVHSPRLLLPPQDIAAGAYPIDRLWNLYFNDKIESVSAEAVKALRSAARIEAPRLSEVNVAATLDHLSGEIANLLTPNPLNGETLIVVSPNDREGKEIVRLAKKAGTGLEELNPDKFPHGYSMDQSLVNRILGAAGKRYSRVIIVELPGAPEFEDQLKAKLEVFIVDHHVRDKDNRYHPRSSLEQVNEIVGGKLTPAGRAVGVRDAAFIDGILELGVNPQEVVNFETIVPPNNTKVYSLRQTKLIILDRYIADGHSFEIQAIVEYYPIRVEVLTKNRKGFHFSGDVRSVAKLKELIEAVEGSQHHYYIGGDHTHRGYIRFEGPDWLATKIIAQFLSHLERRAGLDQAYAVPYQSKSVCWKVNTAT